MEKKWTAVLEPKSKLLDLHLKEVWQYRDLIFLFIKRDFTTKYKQTILGPIWFIVQPLFTTLIQTFVFGNIAHLSTDGLPQFLFYMAGNVPWLYFSTCLTSTSSTFTANAGIFGKVYFPRLTTPIASVISSMLNFVIQFSLFLGFSLFFLINGADITVVTFGITLLMYITPVIFAGSSMSPTLYTIIMLNPVSPVIEFMRYGWLGAGTTPFLFWGISWISTFIILFIGIILFNKVEKNFMDTV